MHKFCTALSRRTSHDFGMCGIFLCFELLNQVKDEAGIPNRRAGIGIGVGKSQDAQQGGCVDRERFVGGFGGITEYQRDMARHDSLLGEGLSAAFRAKEEGDSERGISTTAHQEAANLAVLPRTLP